MADENSTPDAPFGLFIEFVRSITLLALPAAAQEDFLNAHNLAPSLDELALQLDDEIPLVPTFIRRGWMNDRQAEIVAAIDGLLESMSQEGDSSQWQIPALRSERWSEIRAQASRFFTECKPTEPGPQAT